jgi:type I restriction enzyme M protein
MRHKANQGFILTNRDIKRDILIPRYYDPRIEEELHALSADNRLVSIDLCVSQGQMLHNHGDYIPKIYYGTGPIPYIRTSDIANWELKASPKHGIPIEVYEEYKDGQDVKPEDIFFVHEGSYLIGSVGMVTVYDGPLLYQHHLSKFRVLPTAPFGPYFFLAAVESPPVQRQIRSKQFSADIIDSVVGRIGEVVIPVPKDEERLQQIEADVKNAILGRAKASHELQKLVTTMYSRLQTGEG